MNYFNISFGLIDAVRNGRIDKARELIDSYGLSYSSVWSDGYTLLIDALKYGHPDIAKLLLTSGARVNPINQENCYGSTPLHFAVRRCYIDIVEMLLDNGAKIDAKANISRRTPLYLAITERNIELAELFLNRGADANVSDNDGFSLLHVAVMNGWLQIVEHLLNRGAYVNSAVTSGCQKGYTPLHISVQNGDEKLTTSLINNGADINFKGKDNITPLHVAVMNGWLQIVEHLLNRGAYVNSAVTSGCQKGYTPLHISVQNGDEKLSTSLINNGADINFKGKDNITPLHIASMNGYAHIVQNLLNHGACTDLVTMKKGYTPLMIAIKFNKEAVVQLLLQHTANIDSQDKDGCTILNLAVKSGSIMIVNKVLKHCPDINNQSNKSSLKTAVLSCNKYVEESRFSFRDNIVAALLKYGLTFSSDDANDPNLLITSARRGLVEIADRILSFGSDINTRDVHGKTLLHIAIKKDHAKFVDLLLRYGSDINITTKTNRTPLNLAISTLTLNNVIINALIYHIIKMKIANLYVSDENIRAVSDYNNILDTVFRSQIIDLKIFREQCKKELALMKSEKINSSISFYDILTKNTNSLEMYMRNENIVQVLKLGDYETKFPLYASMIKNNFRKSLERKDLVELGPTILNSLFKKYFILPYICAEKILSFLDNKDIKTLMNLQPSNFPNSGINV